MGNRHRMMNLNKSRKQTDRGEKQGQKEIEKSEENRWFRGSLSLSHQIPRLIMGPKSLMRLNCRRTSPGGFPLAGGDPAISHSRAKIVGIDW